MTKEKAKQALPLHVLRTDRLRCAINRAHILIHSFLLSLFLYHRLSSLFLHHHHHTRNNTILSTTRYNPTLAHTLLLAAEACLALSWLSWQAFRWRHVDRSVFVDRLPDDESRLPSVDVLICTADPEKEPTMEVMNTVVSAMALDYPVGKLHVYLSDDGGSSPVTLAAMKEAWAFATWWVPFCRDFELTCRCPMVYFGDETTTPNESLQAGDHFVTRRLLLKEKYERLKERVEELIHGGIGSPRRQSRSDDHPPLVQVINDQCTDPSIINPNHSHIPMLVYIAREKRLSYPHHFKAGALNVLLRVSGVMSNSPIVLVLDCDMYCNDPTSAKQAMCFYLDKDVSPSLAFVQFPQRYRNISKDDIYDTGLRIVFKVMLPGLDGASMGPMLCGTGFYMNRKAIYNTKGEDLVELRNNIGTSNHFLKSLSQYSNPYTINSVAFSSKILQEAEFLASCTYEEDTEWGKEVGFLYHSLLEDSFTVYNLHCRGWKSVYLNPKRAPFLGTTTTNLNDLLTQNSRWYAGCVEIGLSRFCPLVHGLARRRLPLIHSLCYTSAFLRPLTFVPYWCLAIVPQLCLFHGVPLYPKVSSSFFLVMVLIFLSTLLKHLHEVLTTEGTMMSWWNEERMGIIKMLTCITYGSLDAILKIIGVKETSFIPTNKVIDNEQEKMYHQGIYDFRTSSMFLVPLGTVVILNLVCFVGGSLRMVLLRNWDEMVAQVFLSGFYFALSLPIIEGMFVRRDKGRVATLVTLGSIASCLVVMVLGPSILFYN